MIKELVIELSNNKGHITNENSVSLTHDDELRFTFNVDSDILNDEWYYKLTKNGESEVHRFEDELFFLLPGNYFSQDVLTISIIRKAPDLVYPDVYVIDDIKINTVSLIGIPLDEVYPDKIVDMESQIEDLKIAVLALKSEIDDLKKVGDIL